MSVDGFIADGKDDVGPLFDWYFNGDVPLKGGPSGLAGLGRYVTAMWASIGVVVMGRTCSTSPTAGRAQPPAGDHIVVVSHRPKPEGWHPEASCRSSTTWPRASPRPGSWPATAWWPSVAGDVAGQALALGLVDEVAMDVVPVVFGSGKRYFGSIDGQHRLEDPDTVIAGDRVLHLRYRVRQPD